MAYSRVPPRPAEGYMYRPNFLVMRRASVAARAGRSASACSLANLLSRLGSLQSKA